MEGLRENARQSIRTVLGSQCENCCGDTCSLLRFQHSPFCLRSGPRRVPPSRWLGRLPVRYGSPPADSRKGFLQATRNVGLTGWQQIAAFPGHPGAVVQHWASEGTVHVATEDTDLAAELKRGLAFVRREKEPNAAKQQGRKSRSRSDEIAQLIRRLDLVAEVA